MTMNTKEALSYINASLKSLTTRMATLEAEVAEWQQEAINNATMVNKNFEMLHDLVEANKLPTVVDSDGLVVLTQEALVKEHDEFRKEIRGKLDSLQAQIHQLLDDLADNGGRPRQLTHNQLLDAVREMSPDDGTTWSPVSRD